MVFKKPATVISAVSAQAGASVAIRAMHAMESICVYRIKFYVLK
jgi:hypothetical protein